MNQQQRDKLLLKMHENYQEMHSNYQEMKDNYKEMKNNYKEIKEIKEIQKEMWTSQRIMEERQKIVEDTQRYMQQQQEEMKNRQTSMEEELKRLGNIVTRMEYEHGRKLDMILEVLAGHTDKLEEHEKRFEKDEKIIEMHGHQIYGIEQKIQA